MNCLLCQKEMGINYNFLNLLKVNNDLICQNCSTQLEKVDGGCIGCGKKGRHTLCEDCQYWMSNEKTKMLTLRNYSLFYYNTYAKTLVSRIKFSGDVKLLDVFKKEIVLYFKKKFKEKCYLIPIPLHEERLQERGFNQSYVISKLINYPILDIIRKRENDKQSKKSREERILFDENYYIKQRINLKNKSVVIIDDIYTTGATVHKIGKLLYDLGANEINSFTLFRS